MKRPTLAMGCLILLLGACSGPTGVEGFRAELRTDRSSYAPGEEGVLTLRNTGDVDLFTGSFPCVAFVEQEGGRWETSGQWRGSCTLERVSIPAGEEVQGTFRVVGKSFTAGTQHRFSVGVRKEGGEESGITVHSNAFTVSE